MPLFSSSARERERKHSRATCFRCMPLALFPRPLSPPPQPASATRISFLPPSTPGPPVSLPLPQRQQQRRRARRRPLEAVELKLNPLQLLLWMAAVRARLGPSDRAEKKKGVADGGFNGEKGGRGSEAASRRGERGRSSLRGSGTRRLRRSPFVCSESRAGCLRSRCARLVK